MLHFVMSLEDRMTVNGTGLSYLNEYYERLLMLNWPNRVSGQPLHNWFLRLVDLAFENFMVNYK